jgi:hypothetical protein
MLQFYLLSVLMNALAGYILFFGDSSESGGVLEWKCGFSVKDETYRFVVGILSAFTGLFKLLSSIQGDLPLIGDIVPAATGFMCGFILIFEYYRNRSAENSSESARDSGQESDDKKTSGFLVANKKLVGAAAMIAAVLHFLFPTVLLL